MLTGKRWGVTTALLQTPLIEVHRIEVEPEMRCSWHKHERKWNAFAVISGALTIEAERDGGVTHTVLRAGDMTSVRPGEWHRFVSGLTPTVALELYYPAELGEDIVRRDCGGWIHQENDNGKHEQ